MLITNHRLTDSQLSELQQLTNLCQLTDGGLPIIYYNLLATQRDTPNNVLYYEGQNLIGFLSVYFFYEKACEISLLVTPTQRRQGLARELLKTILPLLEIKKITKIIFSFPVSSQKHWLSPSFFTYFQSEYHMERNSYETVIVSNSQLNVYKAEIASIDQLCEIDKQCFNSDKIMMSKRFNFLLNDPNYTILVAEYHNKIIGKAHIRWEDNRALFSDIAILPDYQGKGLGGELLAQCINKALSLGKITLELDVETSNQSALNLYLRHGFKTTRTSDYWSISTQKIKELF